MQNWRKGIAAVLAALGVVASSGLLHGTAELAVNTAVAALGAAAVIILRNDKDNPEEHGTGLP